MYGRAAILVNEMGDSALRAGVAQVEGEHHANARRLVILYARRGLSTRVVLDRGIAARTEHALVAVVPSHAVALVRQLAQHLENLATRSA